MLKTNKNKLRQFGLVIAFGLPLIVGFIIPIFYGHKFITSTLIVSIPFLILSLIKPTFLFYPYKFWIKIGMVLGWFNTRIVLGIVFFAVLIPISLIMKIFDHDPLKIKKNFSNSYRIKKKNYEIDLKRIF